jgi:hypothetical protein
MQASTCSSSCALPAWLAREPPAPGGARALCTGASRARPARLHWPAVRQRCARDGGVRGARGACACARPRPLPAVPRWGHARRVSLPPGLAPPFSLLCPLTHPRARRISKHTTPRCSSLSPSCPCCSAPAAAHSPRPRPRSCRSACRWLRLLLARRLPLHSPLLMPPSSSSRRPRRCLQCRSTCACCSRWQSCRAPDWQRPDWCRVSLWRRCHTHEGEGEGGPRCEARAAWWATEREEGAGWDKGQQRAAA